MDIITDGSGAKGVHQIRIFASNQGAQDSRPTISRPIALHTDQSVHDVNVRVNLLVQFDKIGDEVDVIILGYGLCSRGVVGLRTDKSTLVVPRVDDCIAIFLGSTAAYREQGMQEPGTYYLTKGWIEVGDSPWLDSISA